MNAAESPNGIRLDQTRKPSRKRLFLLSLIVSLASLVAFLFLAELILRQKGLGPWVIQQPYTRIDPPGSYLMKDAKLGYVLRSGESTVTLPGPFTFKLTHLSNGLRVTHPLNTYPAAPKKEIWIFGCSFTHGWSLNDEQTYPWLLQARLPEFEVVNFGVDAYSTLQSLSQMQDALDQQRKPVLVILAYGSFQDSRNTLTRKWVKLRMPPPGVGHIPGSISLPYTRFSADNKLQMGHMPLDYQGLPLLRYSAFANFLDDSYNGLLEKSYRSHEVSKALIEDFASRCKANGVRFVVAGIYNDGETNEMLEYLRSKGIATTNIAVDLNIRENTNLPYDGHPSAIANQQYAQKLGSFLSSTLSIGAGH